MNKLHIAIMTLLGMAQFGLANETTPRERRKKVQALSDTELQKAFTQTTNSIIEDEYNTKKLALQFHKCEFQNSDNLDACDHLKKQYYTVMDDLSIIHHFNDIVYEKQRRQLYQGLVGRSSIPERIGLTKWNNDLADFYRLDKALHTKSKQELLDKQDRIRDKFEQNKNLQSDLTAYHTYYLDMAQIKLLAIERELNMSHRGNADKDKKYEERFGKLQ